MKIKFTLLGTGSSMGVPRPDGNFGKCNPNNKKNYRTRCSALISFNKMNTLIDTSPDLRHQLLIEKVTTIDNVYSDKLTAKYLFENFSYCFIKKYDYPAILTLKPLKKNFMIGKTGKKINIKAIKVKHGLIDSIAYIINGKIAYVSDANEFYKNDYNHFKKLKFLIIDCLRFNKHPSHFNLDDVLKILPNNIVPGYDGLSVTI